jgi:nucleotide-binding universal stress UspA family protein
MVNELQKTVLAVGVDLTDVSDHLIRTTRGLVGRAEDFEIHLIHVIGPEYMPAGVADAFTPIGPGMQLSISKAEASIEQLAREVAAMVRCNIECHIAVGDPAREICRITEQIKADMLIVEAHGRTGLKRVFHRSVAARLSRMAPCSVLTVRPKGVRPSISPPAPDDHLEDDARWVAEHRL